MPNFPVLHNRFWLNNNQCFCWLWLDKKCLLQHLIYFILIYFAFSKMLAHFIHTIYEILICNFSTLSTRSVNPHQYYFPNTQTHQITSWFCMFSKSLLLSAEVWPGCSWACCLVILPRLPLSHLGLPLATSCGEHPVFCFLGFSPSHYWSTSSFGEKFCNFTYFGWVQN